MKAAFALTVRLAARERTILPPMAALSLTIIGVYAYKPTDVQTTWALTALLAVPLSAWMSAGLLRAGTADQREMLSVAIGGYPRRMLLDLELSLASAATVAGVLIISPIVADAFDRELLIGDVAGAAIAHGVNSVTGAQLGGICAPPVVARSSVGIGLIVASVPAAIVAGELLGPVGGPMSVSEAISTAPDGEIAAVLVIAGGGCLMLVPSRL